MTDETPAVKKTIPNKTAMAGGVGGALGVIVVVMAPKLTSITWSAEEGTLMIAALGALFAGLVSYLPKPRDK